MRGSGPVIPVAGNVPYNYCQTRTTNDDRQAKPGPSYNIVRGL
ncbi:hypothetical protein TIFTF001_055012 [Ficus carica]|uniref:Uncharacterized protein n=1 Tax=Ficus carica TaxID=3494 RepID=A0AA88EJ77_FICCA|nr:hypothetical protein TIFTF001_055012 [Ficus carica]